MTPGTVVDIIIGLALILAIFSGWRQGAFASVLSTLGVIAGLICGAALAPVVMEQTESTALRFLLALGTVILLVGIGNLVGGLIGSSLRDRAQWRKTLALDSMVGALFQALATLIVAWLVAIPLATSLSGSVSQGIKNSTILGFVDRNIPAALSTLPSRISAMLNESGLPPLISPFVEGTQSKQVEAPAIKVADTALVERLRPSVIHVLGESEKCSRRLMGSGFVIDESHVITNAHVVAGTDKVSLDTVEGVFAAEVVYYNPQLDIAVLKSDKISLPALSWAQEPAESGADAIVMGFPESGPFEAAPARVSDRITISGADIYSNGRVEREAYTVRGSIRKGNSGGPMVDTEGNVLGVVFGASVDSSDIGYVLTAQEVQNIVGDIAAMESPADTQKCVAS
ncbi:membrane protein [Corynebacterium ulcerans]|uniref:Trypsin-like serine protease n=1 Tax=Corynebacterium ramonii TaxID=3026968 RepID=A0ABM5RQP7_9CORY|nr:MULTISPECIES: MarP family serine protease [Corynebacterium]AIU31850.1 Trypsin-like serine protease [Corynebacterium ramonii FRC0011]AKA95805.1 Trypsin-like serine protease [Corynebacterium ulcerans]ESU59366.1 membrane protein [Corynebacterium ulcerans NCTC 12077]KKO86410.1 membrane protein [Corynebacterium ulcerans]KKO87827.1 membrane protein [Corynebacterium ulcerans]